MRIFFVLVLLFSTSANASIIDNGTYTTVDGIDWLDFTTTVNQTQTQALSSNVGWRVATLTEMENMMNTMFDTTFVWDASGIGYFSGVADAGTKKANFLSLFGSTTSGGSSSYASVEGLGLVGFDGLAYAALGRPGGSGYQYDDVGYTATWNGVALVKTGSVPAPSSYALMIFGLLILGTYRKTQRLA